MSSDAQKARRRGWHLDAAAGTGEPGLTVARLAPRGHVVLTDLSAGMLAVAVRRANAQGIANFRTMACSADDLPFADAAFDSISVRFGYMFFPDLAPATAEFARVLRPGGRLCAPVWVKPEETPWTSIAMRAIAAEAVLAPPDPDGPGMFRWPARERIAKSGIARASGYEKGDRVRIPGIARCIVGTKWKSATPGRAAPENWPLKVIDAW